MRCDACDLVYLAGDEGSPGSLPIVNDDLNRPVPRLMQWFLDSRCKLLKKLSGDDRPRLLDVGCGSGRFLLQFRRYGEVAGVEISSQCRDHASSQLHLSVHASLQDVPRDGGYDIITFWHSLEHIDDPVAVLRAARRLLAPGGFIFISVPNVVSLQARAGKTRWAYYDCPNHLFQFSPSSLKALLAEAGLDMKTGGLFSLEYGPFGALQTALNFLGGPHNYFYYTSKRGWAYGNLSPARRLALTVMNYSAGTVLLLPALLFSLCESALGRSAVAEVVATPIARNEHPETKLQ